MADGDKPRPRKPTVTKLPPGPEDPALRWNQWPYEKPRKSQQDELKERIERRRDWEQGL